MKITYNGEEIAVRGGAWLDIMNSCFYTVIEKIDGYDICKDVDGVVFALPRKDY